MVLEAEEDSLVVGVRPSTNEKELAAQHIRDILIMITEEEETIQGIKEVVAEVQELPIVAISEISWGIDHSSVQIMKKLDTEEHM